MDRDTFKTVILPLLGEDCLQVINWLKQRKLLQRELKCPTCDQQMNWTKYAKTKDGFAWKCQNKYCIKYKSTITIRYGSFFTKSNLSLQSWVHAMYLWSERCSETMAYRQVNVSEKTMIDCYSFFREVCSRYLQANPVKLGGPGVVIQIDESCFSHKPKHHRGRGPHTPIWVFGILDTSTSPGIGYMEIVNKRDAATLLPIIQSVVQQGSIIHSDEWRAYNDIQGLGFTHRTVNHSVNFVDGQTGVHTQAIESYWNKHKSHIKMMRGCRRNSLHEYLQEFMWRDRFYRNAFDNLCNHISLQFPM